MDPNIALWLVTEYPQFELFELLDWYEQHGIEGLLELINGE